MYQSDLHFTSEYTILSGFRINIRSNIESMTFSFDNILMEKQSSKPPISPDQDKSSQMETIMN
jgi:hypothetical protein